MLIDFIKRSLFKLKHYNDEDKIAQYLYYAYPIYYYKRYKTFLDPNLEMPFYKYYQNCQKENYLKNNKILKDNRILEIKNIKGKVNFFKKNKFVSLWYSHSYDLANSIFKKIQNYEIQGNFKTNEIGNKSLNLSSKIYNDLNIEKMLKMIIEPFLTQFYKTYFIIKHAIIMKTSYKEIGATGSQIWHQDRDQGNCINMIFYLHDTQKENGNLELLPWKWSFQVVKDSINQINQELKKLKESGTGDDRDAIRDIKVQAYNQTIQSGCQDKIVQPIGKAGLLVFFSNNLIHKGGFPTKLGLNRYVILFQFFPFKTPVPYEKYFRDGIIKIKNETKLLK